MTSPSRPRQRGRPHEATCIALLLIALATVPCAVAEPLVLDDGDNDEGHPLEPHMTVLFDRDGTMDLAEVQAAASRGEFQPLTASGANFGYEHRDVWLKFTINATAGGRYIVEMPYAPLDRVTLHVPLATWPGQRMQRAGDLEPFTDWPIDYRMPSFPINLMPNQTVTAYLEVSSTGAVRAPAILWHENAFNSATRMTGYLLGSYYGMVIAMSIHNLLLFASLRDRNYLYYVLTISTIGLFAFTYNGFAFQFLWPESPRWNLIAVPLSAAVANIALLRFSRSFLDLRRYTPLAARLLCWLQVSATALALSIFLLPYRLSATLATLLVLVSVVTILVSATLCWSWGNRQARYFMLGWSTLLVGALAFAFSQQGIIPSNAITRNAVQAGASLEMILLAFALADRMRILQRERDRIRTDTTKRMLRDLHDGMGRHFITLIRQAERADTPREHLRTDLRKAFVDMRLLVSSTDPRFRDLATGLATIREQFTPLLHDHGITFDWRVCLGSQCMRRCPNEALNVLRIVQEALTNSVKHASPSTITLHAMESDDGSAIIGIHDDGKGGKCDDKATGGLAHMMERAREHAIDLHIDPDARSIRIELPLV